MDIDELVAAVEIDTGRPDKSALIGRSVRAMVLKAHQLDYFPQDRVSEIKTAGTPAKSITEALPTRWRKFELVRPLTTLDVPVLGIHKFTRKVPDNIFNFDGDVQPNYYYVIGSTVFMESTQQIDKFNWVFFQHPTVVAGTATTWITLQYEQELIDLCNSYVYKQLGDNVSSKLNLELWNGDPRIRGDKGHAGRIIAENMIEEL